jgi:DNA-binding transcriptional regulator YiaG
VRKIDAVKIAVARRLAKSGEGRRIRIHAGLSIGEVAEVCHVSHVSVGRWERGIRRPTGSAAIRYAELMTALDGSVDRAIR